MIFEKIHISKYFVFRYIPKNVPFLEISLLSKALWEQFTIFNSLKNVVLESFISLQIGFTKKNVHTKTCFSFSKASVNFVSTICLFIKKIIHLKVSYLCFNGDCIFFRLANGIENRKLPEKENRRIFENTTFSKNK